MLTGFSQNKTQASEELRHVIASTKSYEDALLLFAEMETYGVSSEDLSITARNVSVVGIQEHLTEAITASMLRSAAVGGTVSALTAVILAALGWIDPLVSFTTVGITTFFMGAFVGALFGMLWRLADASIRPFQTMGNIIAARFDLVSTDASVAERARQLLS